MKPYSLQIEDRNGQFLHAFLAADGVWRLRTSPEEIPDKLKRILIHKEDRYFYYHPGINPVSIGRALVQNVLTGRKVSGASTITMQIARMLEPKERTYFNKFIEAFRALQLEWGYSKDELLERYLSMVPLGGNIEGLKSAALMYYQRPIERLNIAHLFDLILIPNNPNDFQPGKNPDQLFEERIRRAAPLVASGFFSPQDSIVIWTTSAGGSRKQLPRVAQHFCQRIKSRFGNMSEVKSSLDLKIQRTVESLLSNHLRPWKLRGVQNGAVIVIDNQTKEIVAYAGSENFDDFAARGQVDAVKALRSPGSTLKPFLYALQMEHGDLTPKTRLLDTPYDAEGFLAENYDGTYSGLVYADEALRKSLNVPMIRMLKQAGVKPFLELVRSAGISSLEVQRSKLGLSVILGGCGVTLEELATAYSTFPMGGVFTPPSFVKQEKSSTRRGKEIFSASTAYMVTEILSGLDRPDLPNNFESSLNLPTIAFKTGTSYGRRDAWSLGYTAGYTVGVWIGNVTHEGSPELAGSKSAAPLLVDIFNSISTGHQKSILPLPRDIRMREVCATSGHVPTHRCTHLIDDLYSVSHTVLHECEIDKEYFVSPDGKKHFCSSCLADNRYKVVDFEEYPAELLTFWQKVGKSYVPAPPHNPVCTRLFTGDGPKIVSPSDEMTYFLVSKKQRMTLEASSGVDIKEHVWYLDSEYLGRNKAGEKLFISLKGGEHTLSCLDDKGRMSSVKIRVKYVL
jgi:penicillin-binding protein 1C